MKTLVCFLPLLLATSACTSSKSPSAQQAQFQAAMIAQQQAAAQMQQPSVFVRGEVKNTIIPWNQDLSLARAIIAAEYRGAWDPHQIVIIRKGEVIKINPKHLVWGTEDPPLQPGDIIEIER